jgi:CubicO group peptidase (beta-lactamase class C family)
MDAALRALLDDAITREIASAAAVAVGDGGREILVDAVGMTRRVPTPGVTIDAGAVFDLASVSKVMATGAVAMALTSRGRLDLEAPARTLVPAAIDPRVTVRHLLGHASGLPAHVKFYERLWAGDLAGQPDPRRALVHLAATHPLERPPGTAAVYSDLGYITLGAALEGAGGAPLEVLFRDLVAGPLGLDVARFVDLRGDSARDFDAPVVATELDARRGLVQGEVHDENCHAGGGVAGHAGLFAPVREVSAFARAMIELLAGRDVAGLRADVARTFVESAAAPDTTHRLAWDTPSTTPGVSHAGDRWPRAGGYGHLGFTGTSVWLDTAKRRWVVLLTNRVHPSREGERAAAIKDVRRAVMDAVVDALS